MSDSTSGVEENITVGVRIRPLSENEEQNGFEEAWKVSGGNTVTSISNHVTHTFDSVFNGNASTEEVFDTMGKDLVASVLKGMNGTIFAYGQTASGKTHTMEGSVSTPGVLSLAVNQIFDMIDEMLHFQFMIHVSYIEIFNEQVKDLLTDTDENLRIREDPEKGFFVENLSSHSIISIEEIMDLKKKGEKRRHVGETNMNLRSSRSHTIFTLNIEMRDNRVFDENVIEERKYKKRLSTDISSCDDYCFGILIGKLNLVDLAGSENAKMTSAVGERLAEAANINKSLLSLSRVISQLSANANQFINWRDSKLTQILQPCLGGNCKTSVICCIRAGNGFLEESKSTLNFAAKTKTITNKVHVNEVLDGEGEIQKLKNKIKSLETKLQVQIEEKENKPQLLDEIKRLKALMIVGGSENTQTKMKRRKKMRMTWCPGKHERRISFAPNIFHQELIPAEEKFNKTPIVDKRKSVVLSGLLGALEDDTEDDTLLNFNETMAQSENGSISEYENDQIVEMKQEKDKLNQRIAELENLLQHKAYKSTKTIATETTMDSTYNNATFETFAESIVSRNKSTRSSVVTVDIVGKIELENRIGDLEYLLGERDVELEVLREELENKRKFSEDKIIEPELCVVAVLDFLIDAVEGLPLEETRSLENILAAEKCLTLKLQTDFEEYVKAQVAEKENCSLKLSTLENELAQVHLEKEHILEKNNKKLLDLEVALKAKYDEDEKHKLEIISLKQQIDCLKEESPNHGIDFEEKARLLEKDLLQMKNDNVRLQSELNSATVTSSKSNDYLSKEIDQLRFQVDLKTQEIEKFKGVIKDNGTKIQELERSNEELDRLGKQNKQLLTDAIKEKENVASTFESQLKSKVIEVDNLTVAIQKLKTKNENYERELQEIKMEAENSAVEAGLVNNLRVQVDRQLDSIKALESRVETLQTESKEQKETIHLLEENLTNEQQKVFELTNEQETCAKCVAKDEEIFNLKELSDGVKFSVASSEEKINELTSAIQELTKDKSELMNRFNRVTEAKKVVETENLNLQNKTEALSKEVASLEESILAQSNAESMNESAVEELRTKLAAAEKEKKSIEVKIQELQTLIEHKDQRLIKLEKAKLTFKKAQKLVTIAKDRDKLKTLLNDIVDYIKSNFELNEDFGPADVKQVFEELKTEQDSIKSNHTEYRRRIKDLQDYKLRNETLREKYDALKVKYCEMEKKAKDAIAGLEKQNLALSQVIEQEATTPKRKIANKMSNNKEESKVLTDKENIKVFNTNIATRDTPKSVRKINRKGKEIQESERKIKLFSMDIAAEDSGLNSPYKKNCNPS